MGRDITKTKRLANDMFHGLNNLSANIDTSLIKELIEIGENLPETGESNKVYFIRNSSSEDIYTAYVWENNSWTYKGETTLDLATKDDVNKVDEKISTFLGTNTDTLNGIKELIQQAEESGEISALESALGSKASTEYVNTELAKKASTNALDGKLDKVTQASQTMLYGVNKVGQQTMVMVSDGTSYGVVLRSSEGRITTTTPTSDNEAANKKYVDDKLDGKVSKKSATGTHVYVNLNGVDSLAEFSYDKTTGFLIVQRNTNGAIITPTPQADTEAANKKYVDDALGDIESVLRTLNGGA